MIRSTYLHYALVYSHLFWWHIKSVSKIGTLTCVFPQIRHNLKLSHGNAVITRNPPKRFEAITVALTIALTTITYNIPITITITIRIIVKSNNKNNTI